MGSLARKIERQREKDELVNIHTITYLYLRANFCSFFIANLIKI